MSSSQIKALPKFNTPFIGILCIFIAVCLMNIPVLSTLWRHGFDDGTYSHAYLIPFITLYLYFILSQSGKLEFRNKLAITPTILLISSCYLFFITTNAQISVGYWGTFLAIFITSVTMLYRFNFFIIFPAAFLIFIFPFWGILVPVLQNVSVVAVTYMMSFTDVPTYVEGNFVTIPAGVFQIAGGCSGLRYVIVSLAIATLFIFLNIRNTKRAILFFSITILGALLTNWIRITALILIGDYTNMESSLMADHNTFGWYLYVPFMVFLFYWGNSLADEDLINKKTLTDCSTQNLQPKTSLAIVLFSVLLLTSTSIRLLPFAEADTNLTLQSTSTLAPTIEYFTSLEAKDNKNWPDNFIYKVYTFSGSDLDGKPTFYRNSLIPTGWVAESQTVNNNWLKQIITNGKQHGVLFTQYELGGEMVPDRATFKIKRLAKATLGISETKLHWALYTCEAKCPENTTLPRLHE